MSKVKIEGNASGTGTLTISAPNTNTDRTLTLPDGAGEILTSASTLSSSNLSGALPALDGSALTGVGGGKVLQVVTTLYATQAGTSSTSFTATGLEVNITPSATTSKILVMVTCGFEGSGNHIFTIYRDSTNLGNNWGWGYHSGAANVFGMNCLDSPSTTSQVTYTLYQRNNNGSEGRICPNGAVSTIIAMEIDGS